MVSNASGHARPARYSENYQRYDAKVTVTNLTEARSAACQRLDYRDVAGAKRGDTLVIQAEGAQARFLAALSYSRIFGE